jgi:endonuclease/exonuclease/phosphatase family metal-dependent hydrolase
MADRPYRRWWGAVLALLAVGLVGCGGNVSAAAPPSSPSPAAPSPAAPSPAAGTPPASAAPAPRSAVPDGPLRVLQLNLCNSGIAGCYTGRSVAEGVALLRAEAPDLVTLNEICEDDVPVLERALADVVPGGAVTAAFQPHRNGRTGEDYRCRNGQRFGLGLLSRWPAGAGSATEAGVYPVQDEEDPEQRAWLCQRFTTAAGQEPDAGVALCTTHLAYTKREVARAQCQHLFGTVVPGLRSREGAVPTVVSGDLNLGPGDSPDLRVCLPPGSALVDDGGQQRVVGTPELVVTDSRKIPLRQTDHVGLLVTLTGRDES